MYKHYLDRFAFDLPFELGIFVFFIFVRFGPTANEIQELLLKSKEMEISVENVSMSTYY